MSAPALVEQPAVSDAESRALREGVREAVLDAAARQAPLRLVGRGTWLDAGRPVRAASRLELGALRGIVEYTPGDLTLTALAGTSLAELAAVTRREGQWLALDPVGGAVGSIGATIATASAGAASHAFGLPRDNVLGVEFITGTGDVVRGGGRVVKNVAGFDLTRLVTGAWGTLGAITEVTVRLRALPAVDETVALALPDAPGALHRLLAALRDAPLAALALEIVDAPRADALGLGRRSLVLARLGGNEELVRAQRRTLAALGDVQAAPPTVWSALAEPDPAGAAVARLSSPIAEAGATWSAAAALARATDGWATMTAGRAVARVVMPVAAERLRDALGGATVGGARFVFERLPAELWTLAPGAASDRLSRGVRRAFDPHGLLNPGILGEGPA